MGARREEWRKRVERWRDSELTAEELAAEMGLNVGTLRHGKYTLDREARLSRRPVQRAQRRNGLFCGSDDGAKVNTVFVSLLASGHMHQIEPLAYLRDLLCLLPCLPGPPTASSTSPPSAGTRRSRSQTLRSVKRGGDGVQRAKKSATATTSLAEHRHRPHHRRSER